jgi:O-antigen/teichoic acid export membrane protein
VAEAWKREDTVIIGNIYKRSSINQYLVGLLIMAGLFGNFHNIFSFLPEEYSGTEGVIILFAFTNIINVSAGISQYILGTSPLYKYYSYLMLLLIILVLITNYLLIPVLGITGAALASLISMTIFTLLTVFILWKKYRLWPYSFVHLRATVCAILILLFSNLIPEMNLYVDVVVRSSVIILLFGVMTLVCNLSADAKNLFARLVGRN